MILETQAFMRGKYIINNTQEVSRLTKKRLQKMIRDKTTQKSINNEFTQDKHLKAVAEIEKLFKELKLATTKSHKSGESNII